MRSVGSTISLTTHVAIVVVVVLGTAHARSTEPRRPVEVTVVLGPTVQHRENTISAPLPSGSATVVVPSIPAPTILIRAEAATQSSFQPPTQNASGPSGDPGGGIRDLFSSTGPEVLSGPLPQYPELLRQAGIQGRVILEALVDTTGHVDPVSIITVSATNPGFVASARQALLATLFRPAEVGGQRTRMRVRIPFEFTLKSGTAFIH